MKFMVTWSISQEKWLPLLKRFTSMSPQEQVDAGEGVKIIGRWHDVSARSGFALVEGEDLIAVSRYSGRWNPYLDLEIVPVMDDAEATAVARQILADNNA
jgi:hypothetical protein